MAEFKFEITVHAPDDCLVELDVNNLLIGKWDKEIIVPATVTNKQSLLEEINIAKSKLEDLEIKFNKIKG